MGEREEKSKNVEGVKDGEDGERGMWRMRTGRCLARLTQTARMTVVDEGGGDNRKVGGRRTGRKEGR